MVGTCLTPCRTAPGGSSASASWPHQERARRRLHGHVEAVLWPIVDHGVELEGVGDLPARALHDVHARPLEALRFEPLLALHLGRRAGRRRTGRDEQHVPPALGGQRREPGNGARLHLVERGPEIPGLEHDAPERVELAGGQRQVTQGRPLLGIGRGDVVVARLGVPREPPGRHGVHRRGQVGDGAVEIDGDAQAGNHRQRPAGAGTSSWRRGQAPAAPPCGWSEATTKNCSMVSRTA